MLQTGAVVTRVLFDGDLVVGVELADGSKLHAAGKLILAASHVGAAKLLLLSGVGPADELRALGLPVMLDQPHVGRNLENHPGVKLQYAAKREDTRDEIKHKIPSMYVGDLGAAVRSPDDGWLASYAVLMGFRKKAQVLGAIFVAEDVAGIERHGARVTAAITGSGLPHSAILPEGNDLVTSTWDILSGDVKPGTDVLIYDDAGDHAGLQAAEIIAATGAKLEIMTRDRSFAPEVMARNLVPYMRSLQERDVKFTVTHMLDAVRKDGNQLVARIGSDYGGINKTQRHDQIIVNRGTLPNDSLYHELVPHSTNHGAVDHHDLVNGKPRAMLENPDGQFQLFRIGDAVAARNTHAAIHDALRLVKDL